MALRKRSTRTQIFNELISYYIINKDTNEIHTKKVENEVNIKKHDREKYKISNPPKQKIANGSVNPEYTEYEKYLKKLYIKLKNELYEVVENTLSSTASERIGKRYFPKISEITTADIIQLFKDMSIDKPVFKNIHKIVDWIFHYIPLDYKQVFESEIAEIVKNHLSNESINKNFVTFNTNNEKYNELVKNIKKLLKSHGLNIFKSHFDLLEGNSVNTILNAYKSNNISEISKWIYHNILEQYKTNHSTEKLIITNVLKGIFTKKEEERIYTNPELYARIEKARIQNQSLRASKTHESVLHEINEIQTQIRELNSIIEPIQRNLPALERFKHSKSLTNEQNRTLMKYYQLTKEKSKLQVRLSDLERLKLRALRSTYQSKASMNNLPLNIQRRVKSKQLEEILQKYNMPHEDFMRLKTTLSRRDLSRRENLNNALIQHKRTRNSGEGKAIPLTENELRNVQKNSNEILNILNKMKAINNATRIPSNAAAAAGASGVPSNASYENENENEENWI